MGYDRLAFDGGTIEYVDIEHGRWLSRMIPGARGVLPPGAGHMSIMVPFEEIIGELLAAAG